MPFTRCGPYSYKRLPTSDLETKRPLAGTRLTERYCKIIRQVLKGRFFAEPGALKGLLNISLCLIYAGKEAVRHDLDQIEYLLNLRRNVY